MLWNSHCSYYFLRNAHFRVSDLIYLYLKTMYTNKNRIFTQETLQEKVWVSSGFEYLLCSAQESNLTLTQMLSFGKTC